MRFYDDPLDTFEVESFDLDPLRILAHKLKDMSITSEGATVLWGAYAHTIVRRVKEGYYAQVR